MIKRSKTVLEADKYRHELKYICSELELRIVEQKLRAVMQPDSHADENGEYLIRSVYFDDYQRNRFFENEDGVDPREKFRIRAYNCFDGRISLEKKIKSHTMTGKKSCLIDRQTCMKMLSGIAEDGSKKMFHLGHFFFAIDTDHFMGECTFRKTAGDICRALRNSQKAPGCDRIYTAGEKEWDVWQQRKDSGVPVNDAVQKELCAVRDELGLTKYVFPWEK